ncbi:MAG TPA: alcohol dehydrogenase catalytic domain-containing protein [Blastocatellia bacterium]|nr:alcohol dehydrogenase catalytic domain-containing protein [Blastocatellia bacterium]
MKAIRFDGSLRVTSDAPVPEREGEALIRVLNAGICNTDLEIVKGYGGFHGILGHEFVGQVVDAPERALIGKRVVGEINVGCNRCDLCRAGDARHCPNRTVLGIKGRDGAFAEYLTLPARNLLEVPETIDNQTAVFTEPLAAACNILEQTAINESTRVAVVGDGKLALLTAFVMASAGCDLTVIGKHNEKLAIAESAGAQCYRLPLRVSAAKYDVVIEASGSPSGLTLALELVRPRGVVVLKSTHHSPTTLEMSQVVVNEITILGSRCGRFRPAIELLESKRVNVQPLISARFPLEEGLQAFERAAAPGSLKVLLTPG